MTCVSLLSGILEMKGHNVMIHTDLGSFQTSKGIDMFYIHLYSFTFLRMYVLRYFYN